MEDPRIGFFIQELYFFTNTKEDLSEKLPLFLKANEDLEEKCQNIFL